MQGRSSIHRSQLSLLSSSLPTPAQALRACTGPPHKVGRVRPKLNLVPLSKDQVRHVAQLARLGLEPGDEDFYADQLSGILGAIDRLQEVDTEAIPPTAQVVEVENPLREDVPRPGLTQEEALANAPAAVNGFFRVPAIQEEA